MSTATTLAGAQSANATMAVLTSATGIARDNWLLVDGELEWVTDVSLAPTVQVVRGAEGTLAVAHAALTQVAFGNRTEQTTPSGPPRISYSVNGAITLPTVDTTVYLAKSGVAAMTLQAPNKDQTNTVVIQADTANAHTVTNTTPGFNNGGTASDVATFGGAIGDNFVVRAQAGVWNVIATRNVTLAAWFLFAVLTASMLGFA